MGALRRAGHTPELLEVSGGHFAMNAAYPGERKELVREADVCGFCAPTCKGHCAPHVPENR